MGLEVAPPVGYRLPEGLRWTREDNAQMTEINDTIKRLVGVLAPYSEEEKAQILLQAEAILQARDAGRRDHSEVLLEMFKDGSLEASRADDGAVLVRLTDVGLAQAAALVHEMTGRKAN